MIHSIGIALLILAPLLPVLLALPATRRASQGLLAAAVLPLLGLILFPGVVTVEIPWMLLGGSGFSLDSRSRIWLALTLVSWLLALWLIRPDHAGRSGRAFWSPWHLLALGGQAGAILAADMTTFFAFSTLMGYAILGLMFTAPGAALRRAGRYYLGALIVADLLLFESLIIIADTGGVLTFAASAQAVGAASNSLTWFYLAFAAFLLRAGIWPAYHWLAHADQHAFPGVNLFLWGGPVFIGMLGIVRWMPPTETLTPVLGWGLLGLGLGGAADAFRQVSRRGRENGLIRPVIGGTSALFLLAIGGSILRPEVWKYLRHALDFIFIVTLIGVAAAVAARSSARQYSAGGAQSRLIKRAPAMLDALRRMSQERLAKRRDRLVDGVHRRWRNNPWRQRLCAIESLLQRWQVAITIFLILVMVFVFLGLGADQAWHK